MKHRHPGIAASRMPSRASKPIEEATFGDKFAEDQQSAPFGALSKQSFFQTEYGLEKNGSVINRWLTIR